MSEIFVFGSNLAGRHGKGAALHAKNHYGAIYGQGRGRQGNSYAIPTKDGRIGTLPLSDIRSTLPLDSIQTDVEIFIKYARAHPELSFVVTRLGCGLAAHTDAEIAPMFVKLPNVQYPPEWEEYIV